MKLKSLISAVVKQSDKKYSKITSITHAIKDIDSSIKSKDIKLALLELGFEKKDKKLADRAGKILDRKGVYQVTVNDNYDFVQKDLDTKYIDLVGYVFDFELVSFDELRAYYLLHIVNTEIGETFNLFVPSKSVVNFNKLHNLGRALIGVKLTAQAYQKSVANFNVKTIKTLSIDDYSKELRQDYKIENSKFLTNKLDSMKDDKIHLLTVSQLSAIDIELNKLDEVSELTVISRYMIKYLTNHANMLNLHYSMAVNNSYVALPGFFTDFYQYVTEVDLPALTYSKDKVRSILDNLEDLGIIREFGKDELTTSAKNYALISTNKDFNVFGINKDAARLIKQHYSNRKEVVLN